MADLRALNKLISNVAKATANQNERIQRAAVMCIEHAVETGDANPAMRLVKAVAPRFRAPLVSWFETYSRINVAKTGDGFTCNLSKSDKRVDNLDGARVNPWFETEAAKKDDLPIDASDAMKAVTQLASRLQKKIDEDKIVPTDIAPITAIIAALKTLNAPSKPANTNDKPSNDADMGDGSESRAAVAA